MTDVQVPAESWREGLRGVYDAYFSSLDYERRYPQPNAGTLRFLLRHGAHQACQVLDVGCGAGRYALALMERGEARVTGCDISQAAIDRFALHLRQAGWLERAHAVVGGVEAVPRQARFDCALVLFGVLSHIGPRSARVATLREVHARTRPGAKLLLSVPSIWRRRPGDLLRTVYQPVGEPGDIRFSRPVGGRRRDFHYHLYTARRLRQDLAEAGWQLEAMEAESLLPEWLVTQKPWLARLDAWLQPLLPSALGYGIRVMARRRELAS